MKSIKSFNQFAQFTPILLFLGLGVAMFLDKASGSSTIVRTMPPVLRILEKIADRDRIPVGSDYTIKLIVDKLRDDCENGRLVRHMVNIETGDFYVTEETDVLQLDAGVHPLRLVLSTKPLNEKDLPLMQPGIWEITTRVVYDCPDGSDGPIERDFKFSTPPFSLIETTRGDP